MDSIKSWIVTIIGVLLVLNVLKIASLSTLGTLDSGITGWVIALGVIIIGVLGILNK